MPCATSSSRRLADRAEERTGSASRWRPTPPTRSTGSSVAWTARRPEGDAARPDGQDPRASRSRCRVARLSGRRRGLRDRRLRTGGGLRGPRVARDRRSVPRRDRDPGPSGRRRRAPRPPRQCPPAERSRMALPHVRGRGMQRARRSSRTTTGTTGPARASPPSTFSTASAAITIASRRPRGGRSCGGGGSGPSSLRTTPRTPARARTARRGVRRRSRTCRGPERTSGTNQRNEPAERTSGTNQRNEPTDDRLLQPTGRPGFAGAASKRGGRAAR